MAAFMDIYLVLQPWLCHETTVWLGIGDLKITKKWWVPTLKGPLTLRKIYTKIADALSQEPEPWAEASLGSLGSTEAVKGQGGSERGRECLKSCSLWKRLPRGKLSRKARLIKGLGGFGGAEGQKENRKGRSMRVAS